MADEYKPTQTQPSPNISTEHQASGDARRPGDTLDRDQSGDEATEAAGANAKAPVADRDNVGTVTPDDYPKDQQGGASS